MKYYEQLTLAQRYIIEELFALEKSTRFIAKEINVHFSTVARELRRNKNQKGGYRALGAEVNSRNRRERFGDRRYKISGVLEEAVRQLLEDRLSPEQISGRLKIEKDIDISHESIYSWIYKICPGYIPYLRQGQRKRRWKKRAQRPFISREKRKSISERPRRANERRQIGHWERDLIEGSKGKSSLLVLTDRKTRLAVIKKVKSHNSTHVNNETAKTLKPFSVNSLTNDNGIEFGKPQILEKQIKAPVFFANPYSSWERGSVENLNGLIRQYFPKATDFDKVSYEKIKEVEEAINNRPRKMFNYRSSYEMHYGLKKKLIKSEKAYKTSLIKREIDTWVYFLNSEGVALDP